MDENELSQDGYDSGGEESDGGTEESASTSTRLSLDDCQSGDSQDGFKLEIKEEVKDDHKVLCSPGLNQKPITPSSDKVSLETDCFYLLR